VSEIIMVIFGRFLLPHKSYWENFSTHFCFAFETAKPVAFNPTVFSTQSWMAFSCESRSCLYPTYCESKKPGPFEKTQSVCYP